MTMTLRMGAPAAHRRRMARLDRLNVRGSATSGGARACAPFGFGHEFSHRFPLEMNAVAPGVSSQQWFVTVSFCFSYRVPDYAWPMVWIGGSTPKVRTHINEAAGSGLSLIYAGVLSGGELLSFSVPNDPSVGGGFPWGTDEVRLADVCVRMWPM